MDVSASAGAPFDEDVDAIAKALGDVHLPSLLMSMVHMTGDLSLLDGPHRPRDGGMYAEQGGLTDEEQAGLRARAVEVIAEYRDGGYVLPPPPDHDQVLRMLQTLVAGTVGEEYMPMVRGDLHLDGVDPDRVVLQSSDEARAALPVVVIGCGEGGMLAGMRLQEAGIPFTVLEKNDDIGGTWFENRYPGCRVDIPNHYYSYGFEPSDHWTHYFAEQPEIEAYLHDVFDRSGIRPNVRFGTRALLCEWDEAGAVWRVTVSTPGGDTDVLTARAVICAVGQFNRPKIPEIDGAGTFAGPAFHTAQWRNDIDLDGKRIAVIGAGASGFQLVPAIADRAGNVDVYQRTPQWMAPSPHYHEAVGPGKGWAVRHLPFYGRWYRAFLQQGVTDGAREIGMIDPAWDNGGRSVSELNDITREFFTAAFAEQVHDPDLLAKVIPQYPPLGKRLLQDDGTWLATLQRDDVELVSDPIDHIEADAVVTVDGVRRPADVLVWATGFMVSEMLVPLQVVGRDGIDLHQWWDDKPSAHLGITVPGFPNFFMVYGPGTNAANGSSLFWLSECQVHYAIACLDVLAQGHRTLEVREDVAAAYHQATQKELLTMVWSHPAVSSYYKSADGRIYTVMPWRNIDYWHWTRTPQLDDHVLEAMEPA